MNIQKLKAKDLQIGNYVIFNTNNKPFQITAAGLLELQQIEGKPNPYFYEPIPLTPDILDKCPQIEKYEFDNGQENQYRIGSRLLVVREGKIYDYGTSLHLEYLHTLQQLVCLLSNTELIINL